MIRMIRSFPLSLLLLPVFCLVAIATAPATAAETIPSSFTSMYSWK